MSSIRSRSAGALDLESPWGRYAPGMWTRMWIGIARSLPPGRLSSRAGLLARRLARLGLSGPVDTEVWGFKLRLAARGGVSEGRILFLPQQWDVPERQALEDVLLRGHSFVDVGANAGGYTFWAASVVGESGKVVAVEPDPGLAARLAFNAASNSGGCPIEVYAVAVGDRDGEGNLLLDPRNPGENRLLAPDETGDGARITVPVRTLASILDESGVVRPDVLKVDVEGGERAVLEPYLESVERGRWPGAILAEVKGGTGGPELIDWLEGVGYHMIRRTRLNGLFVLELGAHGRGSGGRQSDPGGSAVSGGST